MKIWLLSHSEELKKTTGTGRLVKDVLGQQCDIIVWSRVAPSEAILHLSPTNTLLIYPSEKPEQTDTDDDQLNVDNIIIIDGTWQQARKIYNQSPYLKIFKHHEITAVNSVYKKRRNQKNQGLCTAEVAIHLLNKYQHPATAILFDRFTAFNQ
ncbi:DTW domain-containing protein [Marinomonas sp. M1K-6]|uniref:tRNA-uridine aminocarboxypropyltransferase n=1 Tax=Marinomonas profundi TaxID=2726122 RepID=A0A847RAU3_9GAMM|nr:tRNA-uridine aminocarboxypropyltransferase [Marinomonas profundi]NLQ19146.1 DTW domain-containing protein [Marinomonas profundi]UDV02047.1 DTW domain-containing protein [Marinomonas profundi]